MDRFGLIKLFLRVCGLSLDPNEHFLYKFYSTMMISANLYPIFQLIGVSRYLDNGDDVFEFWIFEAITALSMKNDAGSSFTSVLTFGFFVTVLVKVIMLIYNRWFMGQILYKLQNGIFVPNYERGGYEEEALMKKCVAATDRQSRIYWSIVTFNVFFSFFNSIHSKYKNYDYHEWKFACGRVTLFNTSYSPNYEWAALYQTLSWFPMGWSFAVSDLLTVTVLAHIVYQLKILQNSIRRIVVNSHVKMLKDENAMMRAVKKKEEVDASRISWKYLKPIVENVVEYHLAILDIAQQIESAFNLLVLLIILSGIVLIGSLLYKLNGMHIGGTMCFLCEIILICYWGNEVTLESQKLVDACYKINFFGADLRLQKAICLIMERSKKPIVFTVGKFSPLTLGTFIWIARASYSYLMILRSLSTE